MEELEANSPQVGPSVSNKVGRGDLDLNPTALRAQSCTPARGPRARWSSGVGAREEGLSVSGNRDWTVCG